MAEAPNCDFKVGEGDRSESGRDFKVGERNCRASKSNCSDGERDRCHCNRVRRDISSDSREKTSGLAGQSLIGKLRAKGVPDRKLPARSQMVKTILPNAFSAITARCASTASLKGNVLPTIGFRKPALNPS